MSDEYDVSPEERERFVSELEQLLACYQIASRDDRNVVWAAMNKYLPRIMRITARAAFPGTGTDK